MEKEHLKWVRKEQNDNPIVGASTSSQLVDEHYDQREKIYRLVKMNPFIPIGLVCMWGALGKGISAFVRGDTARSNSMMRYRILFHVLTLVSIVGGSVVAAAAVDNHSPGNLIPHWQAAENPK